MEHRSHSNGLQTFLEHWGFFLGALVAFLASQVSLFFMRLSGTTWIWFFIVSFALMIIGAGGSLLSDSSQCLSTCRDFIAGAGECFYSVLCCRFVCYSRDHDRG